MKTYLQPGDMLSLTMSRAIASGAGVKIGSIFGIASAAYASGTVGQLKTTGVFILPKATGTSFAVGDPVYWDDTAFTLTSTSSANTKVGVCTVAALTGAAGVTVRLNGVF